MRSVILEAPRDRPPGLGPRARARARARRPGRLFEALGSTCRRPARSSPRARSSCRSSSAPDHAARGILPARRPPASRRSPPSGRARRFRRRGCAGTRAGAARRRRRSPSPRARPALSRAGARRRRCCSSAWRRSALFVGIAMLAPRLVRPLAAHRRLARRARRRRRGRLARANAVRNPGRTASTAAALMIGLTLVTLVAVLGPGMRASMQDAVRDQVHADYVVDGDQEAPFRSTEGDELEKVSGVQAASHVRSEKAHVQGKDGDVTGIDPATIARFYHYEWAKGSPRSRCGSSGRRRIVSDDFADEHHLSVGDKVSVTTPSGAKRASRSGASTSRPTSTRCWRRSASARRRSTPPSRRRRTTTRSSPPTRARSPR